MTYELILDKVRHFPFSANNDSEAISKAYSMLEDLLWSLAVVKDVHGTVICTITEKP